VKNAFDAETEHRLRLVSRAKRWKDARGLPTDLTPEELDALGIPAVQDPETRRRTGTPARGAERGLQCVR